MGHEPPAGAGAGTTDGRSGAEPFEARLAVTEACNLGCVFCHNEGLGPRAGRGHASLEECSGLLRDLVRLGCSDLTLTGGEPLLRPDTVTGVLRDLGTLPRPPAVTLVTNGTRLDAPMVRTLASYPAPLKVHVSLHATDQDTYRRVTRCPDPDGFHRVMDAVPSVFG